MIDVSQLIQWKQLYEDVYQLQIQEEHFIFRALGREEYKQIVLLDHNLGEFQEAICFASTLYPVDYDYTAGIAGVAEVLSNGILEVSGLLVGQAEELLYEFRSEMDVYDYQVDVIIHEAFREFTLEEIATWPLRKTLFYLSRAEWILRTLKGVHLQMVEGEEAPQEEYQQPRQQAPVAQAEQPPQRQVEPQAAVTDEPGKAQQAAQTEEEVLAMLAGAGAKVTKPSTDMSEIRPELNWFGYMDELKGDFD